ncbi:MAG: 23S rRNA (pseudouridine(1915)-N(3))-methyltransferase RlmH [Fulvimarina sp.]|nr:23S rRNA (pseudouridine(1915)-N(3))-methyltransferase RlmH [Fulvimarina sp.]
MRLSIAAIGRMKQGPDKALVERYLGRLTSVGGQVGLDYRGLKEAVESRLQTVAERRREEAGKLVAGLEEGCVRIVFDERGKSLSSADFAALLGGLRDDGRRELCFFLGGPDGHDPDLAASADRLLSFGKMTFPHQIARLMLAEQLYRAATILSGHPYHRA